MENFCQSGDVIAERYRVLHVLGQGGSGTTYAVEDLQTGEQIALKALSLRHATNWKQLELFEREAQILEKLNHPNIPRYLNYFQVDTDESRIFYLAQALAEGTSLSMLVEKGWRCNEQGVRQIAGQVLEVLEYLHSQTPPVIHRDIKPQNLIMSESGRISLVDFGAVQVCDRDAMTRGSTVVGTYGYMAPEQFRGDAVPVTDLYGLGTTLLFLLTHRLPSDLPQQRLRIHFRDRVQISETFANWLEKLIEPDVDDRFTSAREALNALRERVLVSKPAKPLNWFTVVGGGVASIVAIAMLVVFRYPVLKVAGFTPPNICDAPIEDIKSYLNQWGDPNLVLECGSRDEEIVKFAIEKGANVNTRGVDGQTALMWASQQGQTDIAKLLIENGSDVNAVNARGQTALIWASLQGRSDIVKLLIEKDTDVNARTKYGETILMWAIREKLIYTAKLLIEKGADVEARTKNGQTALIFAVHEGQMDIAKLLIEKGVDVNAIAKDGQTALMWASQQGQMDIVNLLVEKGADVNAIAKDGETALMWASQQGKTDIVKLLIEEDADINTKNNNGETALMWTSQQGKTDIVKLLIEKGADVNARTKDGETALLRAIMQGKTDIAKLLIEKGADVNARTTYGTTALSYARRLDQSSVIVLLLKQYGAKE